MCSAQNILYLNVVLCNGVYKSRLIQSKWRIKFQFLKTMAIYSSIHITQIASAIYYIIITSYQLTKIYEMNELRIISYYRIIINN